MARAIHTRWKISGTLTAETPIHVGGMGGDADTDLALAVNGRGHYYIPGTSLAGALRGWMSKPFTNNDLEKLEHPVNQIWGFQDKQSNGHASFIIIDDAEVTLTHNMTIEIREGVGIDRHTGAAADGFKYSRAILPKGVTFPLNITLDGQANKNPDELWKILRALEEGDIRIGAAKTRGLGKIKLSITSIHKQKFDAENIFDVLLSGGQLRQWDELKPQQYNSPDKLTLDITWKPKDPVMVKAEGDGIAVDILPLVSQATGKTHFVIPGSSIKGVLRAHAERIVRTVCELETSDKFLHQVQLNLINEVFGAASRSEKDPGKMGALSVDDCYATIGMNPENWSAVENATSMAVGEFKPLVNTAIKKKDERYQTLQPAMHVAVDRWTGGAAEGMLYSVLEPIGVDWGQIGIHLDLERLKKYGEGNVQPAIALLFLVLRDFANRKIPIGYGTNRGMGTVEVTEMKLNCSPIEGLAGIDQVQAITPDLSSLGNGLLRNLTNAWQDWITQNQEAA
ncbi:RAMP superfamily CRISPR-associated protein [Spirulina major]|uniref:RAMP superfamily CRISPR-associated protein n=1 Tax=Spirulina major TaxID=270636 RepID=UPI0009334327|nr:RAMP superfamily CRISPR-associated protein [Spirulina major]